MSPLPKKEEVLLPQVIVTLTLDLSGLQIELPGANGSRRVIPIGQTSTSRRSEAIEETLLRILQAQVLRKIELGLDGAPTERQVLHWERHALFSDPQCPFCQALEAQRDPKKLKKVGRRESFALVGDGSVKVRKIPLRALRKVRAEKSPPEGGLASFFGSQREGRDERDCGRNS